MIAKAILKIALIVNATNPCAWHLKVGHPNSRSFDEFLGLMLTLGSLPFYHAIFYNVFKTYLHNASFEDVSTSGNPHITLYLSSGFSALHFLFLLPISWNKPRMRDT